MRSPAPDFSDPAGSDRDRPARKNFGPDAKPARSRTQRFKPEGSKKAFKERFTGQIFGPDDEDDASFKSRSDWVLVSRDAAALNAPAIVEAGATPAEDHPGWRTWTDDYSNLVQILK